ncbi:MAG: hypothetical protein Q8N87_02405 [bacterium]|nr:hypothetical protein [bacterium]
MIPKSLKKYFWDVDFSKLDKKNYSQFIIERILEYGDERAIKWMRENFKLNQIKNVLQQSKNISRKSANFWRFIFSLNKNKILCLRKSFQEKQKLIWKY